MTDLQVRDALRAGACGLVLRDAPPDQLPAVISALAAGHLMLTPPRAGQMGRRGPEPAAGAVEAERLRFAREVHDVLGRTLAAVNRKSELVAQLLPDQPERARAELEALCVFARRSIAEVRALTRGYRLGDLAAEIAAVRSDLRVMGVRVEVTGTGVLGALPQPVQDAFGWVAREAAANIIHHSIAAACSIEVWTGRQTGHLRIINDGAGRRGSNAGSGLAGLAERLGSIGGTLVHGPGRDLTYRVEATAPLGG
ncbi:sensor histidine kinase [Streptomyces sp. NPDC052236]|uniref:sensor histidine kinase n=1 Tax=Streptomyces sp. NPDC052236 TaxID=3365686 RepID=UPI0037D69F33